MKAPSVKSVRCAIYTRVSTEHGLDQEFNSLDAQYERRHRSAGRRQRPTPTNTGSSDEDGTWIRARTSAMLTI
jgi:hypothetical protein